MPIKRTPVDIVIELRTSDEIDSLDEWTGQLVKGGLPFKIVPRHDLNSFFTAKKSKVDAVAKKQQRRYGEVPIRQKIFDEIKSSERGMTYRDVQDFLEANGMAIANASGRISELLHTFKVVDPPDQKGGLYVVNERGSQFTGLLPTINEAKEAARNGHAWWK